MNANFQARAPSKYFKCPVILFKLEPRSARVSEPEKFRGCMQNKCSTFWKVA